MTTQQVHCEHNVWMDKKGQNERSPSRRGPPHQSVACPRPRPQTQFIVAMRQPCEAVTSIEFTVGHKEGYDSGKTVLSLSPGKHKTHGDSGDGFLWFPAPSNTIWSKYIWSEGKWNAPFTPRFELICRQTLDVKMKSDLWDLASVDPRGAGFSRTTYAYDTLGSMGASAEGVVKCCQKPTSILPLWKSIF